MITAAGNWSPPQIAYRKVKKTRRAMVYVAHHPSKAPEISAQYLEIMLKVDVALTGMVKQDKLAARVMELRYFAGYSFEETAELLNVPLGTVRCTQSRPAHHAATA